MTRLLILLVIFLTLQCSAQTEYLVHINPHDGTMKKIKDIPEVKWIWGINYLLNTDKNQYVFFGSNDKNIEDVKVYTLDAYKGDVRYAASISAKTWDNPVHFVYDKYSKHIYGLYWSASDRTEYFGILHPETGNFERLIAFPDVKYIMQSTYCLNSVNHSYTFVGFDSLFIRRFYTVDLHSYAVTSSDSINNYDPVTELWYDGVDNKYMGITKRNDSAFIVSINVGTGKSQEIGQLPVHKAACNYNTAYDEQTSTYYTALSDNNNTLDATLYAINAEDASVRSSVAIKRGEGSDNLIGYRYDKNIDRIIALFWEDAGSALNVPMDIDIYPNPWQDVLYIDLKKQTSNISVNITDVTGKSVLKYVYEEANLISVERQDMPCGVYLLRVLENNIVLTTKRIVVK